MPVWRKFDAKCSHTHPATLGIDNRILYEVYHIHTHSVQPAKCYSGGPPHPSFYSGNLFMTRLSLTMS